MISKQVSDRVKGPARPRKRFIDGIQEPLQKRRFRLVDVEERNTFEDWSTWRDVVNCSPTDR